MAGPAGLEAFSVLELGPKSLRVKKVKKIGESSDPQKIVAEHELEDFVRVIEPKLGDRNAPNETVFLGLKMATFKDKYLSKGLLGHEIAKKTETAFEYDHKRRLLNPDAKLWSESSKTVPWTSIEELLETVTIKKDRRQRKLREGFERQETRRVGQVGRPKVVAEEDRTEMLRLLVQEGWSRHRIAQRFKDKYSQMTVYRSLPK